MLTKLLQHAKMIRVYTKRNQDVTFEINFEEQLRFDMQRCKGTECEDGRERMR